MANVIESILVESMVCDKPNLSVGDYKIVQYNSPTGEVYDVKVVCTEVYEPTPNDILETYMGFVDDGRYCVDGALAYQFSIVGIKETYTNAVDAINEISKCLSYDIVNSIKGQLYCSNTDTVKYLRNDEFYNNQSIYMVGIHYGIDADDNVSMYTPDSEMSIIPSFRTGLYVNKCRLISSTYGENTAKFVRKSHTVMYEIGFNFNNTYEVMTGLDFSIFGIYFSYDAKTNAIIIKSGNSHKYKILLRGSPRTEMILRLFQTEDSYNMSSAILCIMTKNEDFAQIMIPLEQFDESEYPIVNIDLLHMMYSREMQFFNTDFMVGKYTMDTYGVRRICDTKIELTDNSLILFMFDTSKSLTKLFQFNGVMPNLYTFEVCFKIRNKNLVILSNVEASSYLDLSLSGITKGAISISSKGIQLYVISDEGYYIKERDILTEFPFMDGTTISIDDCNDIESLTYIKDTKIAFGSSRNEDDIFFENNILHLSYDSIQDINSIINNSDSLGGVGNIVIGGNMIRVPPAKNKYINLILVDPMGKELSHKFINPFYNTIINATPITFSSDCILDNYGALSKDEIIDVIKEINEFNISRNIDDYLTYRIPDYSEVSNYFAQDRVIVDSNGNAVPYLISSDEGYKKVTGSGKITNVTDDDLVYICIYADIYNY